MGRFWNVFAIVLVVVAVFVYNHFHDSEPIFPHGVPVFGLVKQIDNLANKYLGLDESVSKKDFPDGRNRPVVFRNGVNTKKWLAPKVFVAEAFWTQEMQLVPNVGFSEDGVFSYFKMDRPLSKFLAAKHKPKTTPRRNMTGKEFFKLWKGSDKDADVRVAYSEVLQRLHIGSGKSHDELIWPLVYPWNDFLVNDTRKEDNGRVFASSDAVTFRLWAGSGGTRTLAHHDYSHNFYVVLSGQKRFVMFPPSSDVYLFPFLHPHATKSQINVLSSKSARNFPRFDPLQGFDVTLVAGDVLYIPPFWIHDVSTELPSFSVAIWSPSRDDGISDALVGLGLPISDRSVALRKQLRIIFLWIAVLLDAGVQDSFGFVSDELLDGRYRFVGPELGGVDASWISENCPAPEDPEGRSEKLRAIGVTKVLDQALGLVFKLSPESRRLVLGNYVEIALHEFVHSSPQHIFTMLHCFQKFLKG